MRGLPALGGVVVLAMGLTLLAPNAAIGLALGAVCLLAVTLIAMIDRNARSKGEFARQSTAQTVQLARQVEESQRLFALLINSGIALDQMNGELERSLEYAQTAQRKLAAEHAAYSKLQVVAQQQAAKARWLEGVAEATTALAHEVNNPLTVLLINLEFLQADGIDMGPEIAEIQTAARRIAGVVKRLTSVANPRSVPYVGESRMLNLSPEEPD